MTFRFSTILMAGVFSLCLTAPVTAQQIVYTDQGNNWNANTRNLYYTQDQGSRFIALSWLRALKHPDGTSFLADGLSRYGYLPMDGPSMGLPVGFPVTGDDAQQMVGMTCSACHTREIAVSGTRYRIDGGPALVDFHGLLVDVNNATQAVVNDKTAYEAFAKEVLGTEYQDANSRAWLETEFRLWTQRFNAIVANGVPHESWGVGRLDAVGMIFNRLTGLDIGPPPSNLLVANIKPADAPVRYPFLWNASIQDYTQWPGFAANGSDLLGLARNVGEVYGVFGEFAPKKEKWSLLGYDYLSGNSTNFNGLSTLEGLIQKMGPPKYPFPVDQTLAAKGAAIFNSSGNNGCADCHGIKPGKPRLFNQTWATPILDVGTDSREYNIMNWTAATGVMEGARIPFLNDKLGKIEPSIDILTVAVSGSILQHYGSMLLDSRKNGASLLASAPSATAKNSSIPELQLPERVQELKEAFPRSRGEGRTVMKKTAPDGSTNFKYESRVLQGIWATAPYLHNGSVPTLADLLKPAAERPAQFNVGRDYDIEKVGLASAQSGLTSTTVTTGCENRNSGNSRCGHEFGTTLPDAEKHALLEYLKTL
ncbi:di-heme-cytochrome C peroxidase [Agrobacterium sp. CG674]